MFPNRRRRVPARQGHPRSTCVGVSVSSRHTAHSAAGHLMSLHCWHLWVDSVQVAPCYSPVTCAELVDVYGVLPNIGEDRLREPATHYTPE